MHILFVDYQWYDITLNIMHFSKPDRIGFLFVHLFCLMFPFIIHRVLVVNNTEAICNCQCENSGINNQKTIKHQIANHYACNIFSCFSQQWDSLGESFVNRFHPKTEMADDHLSFASELILLSNASAHHVSIISGIPKVISIISQW